MFPKAVFGHITVSDFHLAHWATIHLWSEGRESLSVHGCPPEIHTKCRQWSNEARTNTPQVPESDWSACRPSCGHDYPVLSTLFCKPVPKTRYVIVPSVELISSKTSKQITCTMFGRSYCLPAPLALDSEFLSGSHVFTVLTRTEVTPWFDVVEVSSRPAGLLRRTMGLVSPFFTPVDRVDNSLHVISKAPAHIVHKVSNSISASKLGDETYNLACRVAARECTVEGLSADTAIDAATTAYQLVLKARNNSIRRLFLATALVPRLSTIEWGLNPLLAIFATCFVTYYRKQLLATARLAWLLRHKALKYARASISTILLILMSATNHLPGLVVQTPASMWLNVVAEEWLKRLHFTMPHLIVLYEAMRAARNNALNHYLPTAVMHYATAQLPPLWGVALHYAWNLTSEFPGMILSSWYSDRSSGADKLRGLCATEVGPLKQSDDRQVFEWTRRIPPDCPGPKVRAWRYGPVCGPAPLVYNGCECNALCAVDSRIGCPTLWEQLPDLGVPAWKRLQKRIKKHTAIRNIMVSDVRPLRFDEWVKRYPAHMRNTLKEARDRATLDENIFVIKPFIKHECLPLTDEELLDKKPKPRIIQARHDGLLSTLGPVVASLSKLVRCELGCLDGRVVTAMGFDAHRAGRWYSAHEGLVPVCFDMKMFDASTGPGPFAVWGDILKRHSYMASLVTSVRRGKLFATLSNGSTFKRLAQISSGDVDTSTMANVIHAMIWLDFLRIEPEFRVLIMGDDSIAMVPPAKVDFVKTEFVKHSAQLGYEAVYQPDDAFCSGLFWPSYEGHTFGPLPGRLLNKLFWSIREYGESKSRRWAHTVALGLSVSASHVPIAAAFVEAALSQTTGPILDLQQEHFKIQARYKQPCHPSAYSKAAERYGCSVQDIIDLEKSFRSMKLEDRIDSPLALRVVMVDCG